MNWQILKIKRFLNSVKLGISHYWSYEKRRTSTDSHSFSDDNPSNLSQKLGRNRWKKFRKKRSKKRRLSPENLGENQQRLKLYGEFNEILENIFQISDCKKTKRVSHSQWWWEIKDDEKERDSYDCTGFNQSVIGMRNLAVGVFTSIYKPTSVIPDVVKFIVYRIDELTALRCVSPSLITAMIRRSIMIYECYFLFFYVFFFCWVFL